MIGGFKRYAFVVDRRKLGCALGFAVLACGDGETSGNPPAQKAPVDAAAERQIQPDANTGAVDSSAKDAASADVETGAQDAGADAEDAAPDTTDAAAPLDAAADAIPEAGTDASDATATDAHDAAPDAHDAAAEVGLRCATLDCDDGIGCTVDSCDEALGCIHTASDALCDDNRVCSGSETCSPIAGCQPGTPLDCKDSNRCTFDYCSEPAGGCAHHDVSTSVELLINGDFDYGENLGWRQFPAFAPGGSLIWEEPTLANTPDWFAWLGGVPDKEHRVWQAVEVPAAIVELTLSGVYSLIPLQGPPSLQSYFRVEISDALTGTSYGRALSLTATQTTDPVWVAFSLTTTDPLAGKVIDVTVHSLNGANDDTNFFVDTLSLRAKVCPTQ